MRISPIMFGNDNYCWLLQSEETVILVDPGESGPVLRALDRRAVQPRAVLLTHHHRDHTGGVTGLQQLFPKMEVYIHLEESRHLEFPHTALPGDAVIRCGGLTVTLLHTPGHTSGSACYLTGDALFTGDTLFCCGCGRLFEESAATAWNSLQRLTELPEETRVFPGHEYTMENLRFAETVDPENPLIRAAMHDLAAGVPRGLPSTIGREKQLNPFMRCAELDSTRPPEAVFAAFRARKDRF